MFVFHRSRLQLFGGSEFLSKEKKESLDVVVWANGASDHLYDLITGSRVPAAQRARAQALAAAALRCGHGFTDETWTIGQARGWLAEADDLLALVGGPATIEEAMEVDRRLGLRPELGKIASCSRPMEAWTS
jgi:hypothetical protein